MKQRAIVLAGALIIAISNYVLFIGNDGVRTIQFLSIWAIGALSSLLIHELIGLFKNKSQ